MDSLDEMPEFGPEEERVPLIVPDGGPKEYDLEPLPLVRPFHVCKGVNYNGKQCERFINHLREYCIVHDPTPDELMKTLMSRLQSFVENCEACGAASAEEILTIAAASKAFAILWDRKPNKEQAQDTIKRIRFTRVG